MFIEKFKLFSVRANRVRILNGHRPVFIQGNAFLGSENAFLPNAFPKNDFKCIDFFALVVI